ncbi:hypothetical protein RHGRI_023351 [Rhododendron griersonianum]|uniref:Uncharacterized protein n=1 Tax=Rhododendron griersonianum TaxID=479676 RepID=A0AAV6J787_9ERIC|nr:hypothetical protein RHGRI_023351 [Rhododendron griersonianum]
MSELPLKPCSPAIAKDGENDGESKFDWDSHGLQADATIPVRNLDAFKKYKVSYVYLYEVNRQRDLFPVGAEDSLFECVSLRPNRVYTKSQLLKELETLSAALGVFENVDLLAGTLPDGTIRIGIFIFSELSASAASPLNTVITPIMSELPLKPRENDDESKFDWDSHGLQADATIPVRNLDAFKKYKVSYVYLYEVNSQRDLFPVGAEDSLFECVSLRPNGVYTKSQLLKELETLSALGVFENVDLMAGTHTHPDGTICIAIYISEWEWLSANSIKCINVGLLPPWQPMEMSPNMTDEREQMEYIRSLEREYNKRVDEA